MVCDRVKRTVLARFTLVLILILLEYGLRPLKSQIIDFQTLKALKELLLQLINPKYVPFSPANIGILFIADCILAI